MTLEEIVSSDTEITEELLNVNGVTLDEVLSCTYYSEINIERFLSILMIFDKKSENTYLKFLIMFYNIKLNNFEEAYKYALKLYSSKDKYEKDINLYITLLEELRGVRQHNFSLKNILADRYDERFSNVSYHNYLRTLIFNKEYDKAFKGFRKLFNNTLNPTESIMYYLLKAIKNQKRDYMLYCIENGNIEEIRKCLSTYNQNAGSTKNQIAMCDLLDDVLYGIPLDEPTELPKCYDIYDIVAARDIDKIIKFNNDSIITAMAKKIRKTQEESLVYDYKGELSGYLYDTLECIYNCIQNKDFSSADEIIWKYLETIKKDSWIFYILNILNDFESSYESMNEDARVLKLAEIFDLLVLVSRTMTDEMEDVLIEKYMAPKKKVHPYSKVHEMDIEYNYNIEGISEIIESIKNNTINYAEYANKEYYTEEDVFKISIMARENYRIGNTSLGDTLIKIADNLAKQYSKKSSEISFFIKAISENKDILKGKKVTSFSEEVKMLLL